MNKEEYIGSMLRVLLSLVLSSISALLVMMMSPFEAVYNPQATVADIIRMIIGIAVLIGIPLMLGRIFLKTTYNVGMDLLSLFLPVVIYGIIMLILMAVYSSDDSMGFIVLFLNAPGFILYFALSERGVIPDEKAMSVMLLMVGLSSLFPMIIMFIGLRWKRYKENRYIIVENKTEETTEQENEDN